MSRTTLIAVSILLYLPLGLCGADYLAGMLFSVINKRMPDDLSLTTWPTSWQAYGEDPIQRKRLQMSAAVGGFVWFGLPVLMGLSLQHHKIGLTLCLCRPGPRPQINRSRGAKDARNGPRIGRSVEPPAS